MSATVETVYLYQASCADCTVGPDACESEDEALEWAATHNAECHEPDDGEDENYERFKESRYGN